MQFSIATLLTAFAAGLGSVAQAADTNVERPNVLFIFADDQCYDTINAMGNQEIATPSLDRLCKAGTTFTHAYNQGSWSGAVCVASRTMLNTGRYLWHANRVYRTTETMKRFTVPISVCNEWCRKTA